jgi:hypothetical protein
MREISSPVTEDYWWEWIAVGGAWREMSPEHRAAVLARPLIDHLDDAFQPNFSKAKIGKRADIGKFRPEEVEDPEGWLVLCRLMQIYHSAGPVFSAEFDAQAHADFLGKFVFCSEAKAEFHRGYYDRFHSHLPQANLSINASRFGSVRRLREFLDIPQGESAAKWEKSWRDGTGGSSKLSVFSGVQVTECARRLLARVADAKQPVPLWDLTVELAEFHRGGFLAKALRALTNHVLMVVACDVSGELVAGLWPPLRQRAAVEGKAAPPQVLSAEPTESFGIPFLLGDLAAVLLAARAEPLPIKQGKMLEIYAAKAKELNRTLIAVPSWVCDRLYEDVSRVQVATGAGHGLGFLAMNRHRTLDVTAAGGRWLGRSAPERLRVVLDTLMERRWKKTWHSSNWNFWTPSGRFRPNDFSQQILPLEKGLSNAFLQLPADGSSVSLDEFLAYASRAHNPLFEAVGHEGFLHLAEADSFGRLTWKRREAAVLDAEIRAEMRTFLEARLVPLGAVRLGRQGGKITLALTSIGRYFLGAARSFELPEDAAAGRVVLQPNFDLVFLGPNLAAEAELAPYCERTGVGTGTVFRLTKASVQAALQRGLATDNLLDCLRETTGRTIPQNVQAEVEAWAAARQTYSVRKLEVLRCDSPEAAQHIHSLLPHNTRLLGGPCLEVFRPLRGPDRNRLEKAGFYKRRPDEDSEQ